MALKIGSEIYPLLEIIDFGPPARDGHEFSSFLPSSFNPNG